MLFSHPSPDVQHDGQQRAEIEAPLEELAPVGDRDTRGRFVAGNGAAVVTGARSAAFWREVSEAKAAIVARVLADVQGGDEASEIKSGVVEQYAEAKLLRRSLFIDIAAAGGTATAKRHARRLLAPYGQAFDRELKAAQVLGLERRARDLSTMSIGEYLAHEQRQREQPITPQESTP